MDEKRQGPTGRRVSYRKVCNTVRPPAREWKGRSRRAPTFQKNLVSCLHIDPHSICGLDARLSANWSGSPTNRVQLLRNVNDNSETC